MTAVYAPGRDRPPSSGVGGGSSYSPSRGAGGVFAEYLQGFTPKYAANRGYRSDLFRNTLARMFVRVDASEMNLFLASISDAHTQNQLAPRIAGDPTQRQRNRTRGGAGSQDAQVRANQTFATNGYLDFFISQASMPLQEKVDVKDTLADNYVAFFFGQQPPVWSFTGWLMNTVQDDQATNFLRLYLEILRGTQLARRQKIINLKIDSYVITGAMTGISPTLNANSEIYVPFAFQLLVKRVDFVNYTRGWVPTRAFTPFAADPNAIPYDGRARNSGARLAIAGRVPPNTEEVAPVPNRSEDSRVNQAPISADPLASVPPLLRRTDPNAPQPAQSFVDSLSNGLPGQAQSSTVRVPLRDPQTPEAPVYSSQPETLNYSTQTNQSRAQPLVSR